MKDLVFHSYEQDLAQLRLARIQNGVHPDYVNGHPKHAEKTGAVSQVSGGLRRKPKVRAQRSASTERGRKNTR